MTTTYQALFNTTNSTFDNTTIQDLIVESTADFSGTTINFDNATLNNLFDGITIDQNGLNLVEVLDNAITTNKILDNAITNNKILNNEITDSKILTLNGAKIFGTIDTTVIGSPLYIKDTVGGVFKWLINTDSMTIDKTLLLRNYNDNDYLVGESTNQTLTNKTIVASNNTISGLLHGTQVDNPVIAHGTTSDIVGKDDVQTLTNKTLTNPVLSISDINLSIFDNLDNTKILNLQCSSISTGTTITLTAPNNSGVIALTSDIPGSLSGFTNSSNTALGVSSLDSITTGQFNTSVGISALTTATSANHYSAFGYNCLYNCNNTTGPCSAFGSNSQYTVSSGIKNNSFGYYSLYNTSTGSDNIAIGNESLFQNTTSSNNIAIGTEALYNLTTTGNNLGIGYRAGKATTSGQYNNFIGYSSGVANTTGSYNHFIGYNSGVACTTGSRNFAIGYNALGSLTTTDQNIAIGDNAVYGCTTGTRNVGIATNSLYNISTGNDNVAIGDSSGYGINSGLNAGGQNVFIGSGSRPFSTCNNAVCVGYASGQSTGSSGVVAIGSSAGPTSSTHNNLTCIGNSAGSGGTGSNRFYTNTGLSSLSATTLVYNSSTGQVGPTSSNSIFKKDIVNYTGNSENIFNVQAKKFRYKDDDSNSPLTIGYLAEELDKILPECVVYDKHRIGNDEKTGVAILGDTIPFSIRYDLLVIPIIEEMKKLKQENIALGAETVKLRTDLDNLTNIVKTLIF